MISACSSGVVGTPSAAPTPGYSISALLQQVPQSAGIADDGSVLLSSANLNAASEQAGLKRPPATASLKDQLNWITPLTTVSRAGVVATACLVPDAVNIQEIAFHDEFAAEVGWNLWQVDTFINSTLPPERFGVMTGRFDRPSIESALGQQTDGYWATPGQDYESILTNRSVASPLGQPARVALAGTALANTTLAVSLSTPDIQSWVTNDSATMADDPAVLAVAQALDDHSIYAAYIARSDFRDAGAVLRPFDTVGIGVQIVDGKGELVLVYHHDSEQAATANVEALKTLVTTGSLLRNGAPISELLTVKDVATAGRVLTATLELTGDALPTLGWNMLFDRDMFFIHS